MIMEVCRRTYFRSESEWLSSSWPACVPIGRWLSQGALLLVFCIEQAVSLCPGEIAILRFVEALWQ